MFPFPSYDQKMIQHLRELMESGAFSPLIDRVYPLDEIVEAYRYAEQGQMVGNVVISLEPSSGGLRSSRGRDGRG